MFKSAVLCVALAGTTASSVWLWHQLRHEREANLQLQARLETRQPQSTIPAPAPVASIPTPPASPMNVKLPVNVKLPAETAIPDSRPDFREGQRRLLANPEYRKSLRDRQRLEIEYAYRDLPRLLNLSADQTSRLFDLMAEQGVKLMALQSGWPATQVDGKSLTTMTAELRKQNDAERGELLGERNLQELKEFSASLESRNEVDALRAELARTAEPMREDQFDSLLAVVHTENQRADQELKARAGNETILPPGFTASGPASVEVATAANQRIVDSAAMLLTPSQLSTVKDFYRRQRLQMETRRDLERLQVEAISGKP
jgi:hypothetical protein